MTNQPFVIERTYNAPIERVWQAITNKEAMKHWYFDIAEFKPEVGFEFQFEGGDPDGVMYRHLCKIVEAVPLQKLKHTWTYEGHEDKLTWVTYELFAEGEKTRVKLTHEGLENLPNLPVFAKENFMAGWTEIIGTSLPAFVEEDTLYKSIETDASPEKIWSLLVNMDNVRQWADAFHEGTYAESDYLLGSEVVWKTTDGAEVAKGVITELDAPRNLKISYYDDLSDPASKQLGRYIERYTTSVQHGKTVVSIESGPISQKWIETHAAMWDKALELIKAAAER